MSLLPLIVSFADDDHHHQDYLDPWHWSHSLMPFTRTPGGYWRDWHRRQLAPRRREATQNPVSVIGKDGFQVCMDVRHFAPNEITVKTVDNAVIIEAKHEEKQDDQGYVSRQFMRRYVLPEGYDVQQVVSSLSSDGVLTVKAPPPQAKELQGRERVVQIQQTGPAHLSVKKNEEEGKAEQEQKK